MELAPAPDDTTDHVVAVAEVTGIAPDAGRVDAPTADLQVAVQRVLGAA